MNQNIRLESVLRNQRQVQGVLLLWLLYNDVIMRAVSPPPYEFGARAKLQVMLLISEPLRMSMIITWLIIGSLLPSLLDRLVRLWEQQRVEDTLAVLAVLSMARQLRCPRASRSAICLTMQVSSASQATACLHACLTDWLGCPIRTTDRTQRQRGSEVVDDSECCGHPTTGESMPNLTRRRSRS